MKQLILILIMFPFLCFSQKMKFSEIKKLPDNNIKVAELKTFIQSNPVHFSAVYELAKTYDTMYVIIANNNLMEYFKDNNYSHDMGEFLKPINEPNRPDYTHKASSIAINYLDSSISNYNKSVLILNDIFLQKNNFTKEYAIFVNQTIDGAKQLLNSKIKNLEDDRTYFIYSLQQIEKEEKIQAKEDSLIIPQYKQLICNEETYLYSQRLLKKKPTDYNANIISGIYIFENPYKISKEIKSDFINYFNKAIAIDSNQFYPYLYLGFYYYTSIPVKEKNLAGQRVRVSDNTWNEILGTDPVLKTPKYKETEYYLLKAINKNNTLAEAYYKLGLMFEAQNNINLSKQYLDKACSTSDYYCIVEINTKPIPNDPYFENLNIVGHWVSDKSSKESFFIIKNPDYPNKPFKYYFYYSGELKQAGLMYGLKTGSITAFYSDYSNIKFIYNKTLKCYEFKTYYNSIIRFYKR